MLSYKKTKLFERVKPVEQLKYFSSNIFLRTTDNLFVDVIYFVLPVSTTKRSC